MAIEYIERKEKASRLVIYLTMINMSPMLQKVLVKPSTVAFEREQVVADIDRSLKAQQLARKYSWRSATQNARRRFEGALEKRKDRDTHLDSVTSTSIAPVILRQSCRFETMHEIAPEVSTAPKNFLDISSPSRIDELQGIATDLDPMATSVSTKPSMIHDNLRFRLKNKAIRAKGKDSLHQKPFGDPHMPTCTTPYIVLGNISLDTTYSTNPYTAGDRTNSNINTSNNNSPNEIPNLNSSGSSNYYQDTTLHSYYYNSSTTHTNLSTLDTSTATAAATLVWLATDKGSLKIKEENAGMTEDMQLLRLSAKKYRGAEMAIPALSVLKRDRPSRKQGARISMKKLIKGQKLLSVR